MKLTEIYLMLIKKVQVFLKSRHIYWEIPVKEVNFHKSFRNVIPVIKMNSNYNKTVNVTVIKMNSFLSSSKGFC